MCSLICSYPSLLLLASICLTSCAASCPGGIGRIDASSSYLEEGGNLELNCTLSEDCSGCTSRYLYFWKDNRMLTVDYLDSKKIIYRKRNFGPHDAGMYYCYNGTSIDDKCTVSKIQIFIRQLDLLSCESNNYEDMTCSWSCPDKYGNNISAIAWGTNGNRRGNCSIRKHGHKCSCYFCGANTALNEMCPYGQIEFRKNQEYTMTISAYNLEEEQDATFTRKIYTNTSIVKLRPVRNLKIVNITETSITVRWMLPEFPYDVKCLVIHSMQRNTDSKEKMVHRSAGKTRYRWDITLTKLHPRVKYNVTVQCKPEGGDVWSESVTVVGETLSSVRTLFPKWTIVIMVLGAILFIVLSVFFLRLVTKKLLKKFRDTLPNIVVAGRTTLTTLPEGDAAVGTYTAPTLRRPISGGSLDHTSDVTQQVESGWVTEKKMDHIKNAGAPAAKPCVLLGLGSTDTCTASTLRRPVSGAPLVPTPDVTQQVESVWVTDNKMDQIKNAGAPTAKPCDLPGVGSTSGQESEISQSEDYDAYNYVPCSPGKITCQPNSNEGTDGYDSWEHASLLQRQHVDLRSANQSDESYMSDTETWSGTLSLQTQPLLMDDQRGQASQPSGDTSPSDKSIENYAWMAYGKVGPNCILVNGDTRSSELQKAG